MRVTSWFSQDRRISGNASKPRGVTVTHIAGRGCYNLCTSFGTHLKQIGLGMVESQRCEDRLRRAAMGTTGVAPQHHE